MEEIFCRLYDAREFAYCQIVVDTYGDRSVDRFALWKYFGWNHFALCSSYRKVSDESFGC